jgi:hypothetical protein
MPTTSSWSSTAELVRLRGAIHEGPVFRPFFLRAARSGQSAALAHHYSCTDIFSVEVSMALDALKEAGVRIAANRYLGNIGEIKSIDIERDAGRISLQAALRGEPGQVRLEVDYHLDPEELVLERFRSDREWLEEALNRYLAGKRIGVHNDAVEAVLNLLF